MNSLSFVHPNTGSDTQGMVNRWSVVERGLSRTGTFKELYESNLHEFTEKFPLVKMQSKVYRVTLLRRERLEKGRIKQTDQT